MKSWEHVVRAEANDSGAVPNHCDVAVSAHNVLVRLVSSDAALVRRDAQSPIGRTRYRRRGRRLGGRRQRLALGPALNHAVMVWMNFFGDADTPQ